MVASMGDWSAAPSARATCPRHSPCSNVACGHLSGCGHPGLFPLDGCGLGCGLHPGWARLADALPLLTQAVEQTDSTETIAYMQALCVFLWGRRICWLAAWRRRTLLADALRWRMPGAQERGHQAYALQPPRGDLLHATAPPEAEPAATHYRQALRPGRGTGHASARWPTATLAWVHYMPG